MKFSKLCLTALIAAAICSLCACGGQTDAGVLYREAKNSAGGMKSCVATINRTLAFTAGGKKYSVNSSGTITYAAKPFALKSVQTSQNGDASDRNESYTVTQDGALWYYCETDGVWQKTSADGLDTSPLVQIDILRLLEDADSPKYVRKTTYNSQSVHKIEFKLNSEALRSAIESITNSTGMAENSKTIVQTLLDSAPSVYGYCYINTDSGQIVHVETDMTEAMGEIFKNIDGGVKVDISTCKISGDITKISSAPKVTLPADAANAGTVKSYG